MTGLGDCPLCGRPMLDDGFSTDRHHLVPKSKRGKETERLHKVCHGALHARWTEKELAERFNNIEDILGDESIRAFVAWVRKRPADFTDSSKDAAERRQKRKR